jgi:hypothetical protein
MKPNSEANLDWTIHSLFCSTVVVEWTLCGDLIYTEVVRLKNFPWMPAGYILPFYEPEFYELENVIKLRRKD